MPAALLFVVVFCVALYARLSILSGVMALQDTVGPFWAAIRADGRPHADPYGIAMLVPYWGISLVSGSLWSAVNWLAVGHSLVAPLATWTSLRCFRAHWILAALIGLIVGLDPGLVDTFQSGAETYFAALFVGIVVATRGTVSWLAFAFAVANHPMALATVPFLFYRNRNRRPPWFGIAACVLLVGVQAAGWGSPGVGSLDYDVSHTVEAYANTGGLYAIVIAMGPVVGLFSAKTRLLAVHVWMVLVLLVCMGSGVEYLRDHHLRLVTVPAVLCWAGVPRMGWAILAMALVIPRDDPRPPESGLRSSTLGLVSHLGQTIETFDAPMIVDRVWISGDPGAEPSALMLDLWLRDWGPIEPGETMAVVIAGTTAERAAYGSIGQTLLEGQGYEVVVAKTDDVRVWSRQLCGSDVRLGGAWDALSSLHPDTTTEGLDLWWECP